MGNIEWTSDLKVTELPGNRLLHWRAEISECFSKMKDFGNADVTDIFLQLSQFSARASEMRSQIGQPESKSEQSFRTRIIDPFIEECDRQFKIHSRIQAIHEMDAKLSGGRFT